MANNTSQPANTQLHCICHWFATFGGMHRKIDRLSATALEGALSGPAKIRQKWTHTFKPSCTLAGPKMGRVAHTGLTSGLLTMTKMDSTLFSVAAVPKADANLWMWTCGWKPLHPFVFKKLIEVEKEMHPVCVALLVSHTTHAVRVGKERVRESKIRFRHECATNSIFHFVLFIPTHFPLHQLADGETHTHSKCWVTNIRYLKNEKECVLW